MIVRVPTQDCRYTPEDYQLEPENDGLEDDFALPGVYSQVPAVNLSGCKWRKLQTCWRGRISQKVRYKQVAYREMQRRKKYDENVQFSWKVDFCRFDEHGWNSIFVFQLWVQGLVRLAGACWWANEQKMGPFPYSLRYNQRPECWSAYPGKGSPWHARPNPLWNPRHKGTDWTCTFQHARHEQRD